MLKLIMAALVIGVLWAALSGRMPELPPHIAERIEAGKDVLQAVREPAQEAAMLPAETLSAIEMKANLLALTPIEPAVPITPTHPYQDLLTAGVVTPEFGSEASGLSLPEATEVTSTSKETPVEPQVFSEDYYRLKRKLFSAIAILEGQGDDQ